MLAGMLCVIKAGAFRVGARNGAEILAYENDEDDFACIGALELFKARRMLGGSNS